MTFTFRNRKIVLLVFFGAVLLLVWFVASSGRQPEEDFKSDPRIIASTDSEPEILESAPLIITSTNLTCHADGFNASLPEISESELNPNKRNIFFLETSCRSYENGKIFIKARQACAIESTARLNPDMDVYLLYASSGEIKDTNTESDRFLRLLNTYPNIKIRHFFIPKYIKGSPVEGIFTSGRLGSSPHALEHTSDILRLLALWKFGGIYMDLDIVVIKSFETLSMNFVGAEWPTSLANGALGFDKDGPGHQFLQRSLEVLQERYDGQQWAYNGPYLISRMLEELCPERNITEIIKSGSCQWLTVYPPSTFFRLPYTVWRYMFVSDDFENIRVGLEKDSYTMHVWNKLSSGTPIAKDAKNVPYLYFASLYCPHIVQELDKYF